MRTSYFKIGTWFNRSFFFGWVLLLILALSPLKSEAALRLDQHDVVIIVLKQNLTVLARSFDPKIAQTLITEVESQFDTFMDTNANYLLDRSDKESIVFGTDNREINMDSTFTKKFPFGMTGTAGISNRRESTNSAFATDPAFFDTRLAFEVRAPFLRNRFGKSDRGDVKVAKINKDRTEQSALFQVENQVYLSLTTYWNLVASRYFVKLTKRFLRRSREFLKVTQEKRVIGLSEDPDVLAAKAQLVVRKTEVLRANNLVKDFQQQLKNQLDLRFKDDVIPKDDLRLLKKPVTRAESMKVALASRNDYQSLLIEAQAKDVEISIAKDQKWPALDLFTSLRANSVDPSYGTALGQTFSFKNPEWNIGLNVTHSIDNRFAKSNLDRRKLEKAQLLIDIKKLENNIFLEIDESMRELDLQRQERINFRQVADLQGRRLDIEEKNFLVGRSSSDIIVRFQNDYLDAEKAHLDSELREKLAWLDLKRATSTLIPPKLKKLPGETR